MQTAYWCILIAALLPYLWTGIAKTSAPRFDNRDPRDWLARQDNPRVRRANGAQLNAFEAFAPFAASVLMAQLATVDAGRIGLIAIAFVVFRVLHGAFYLANLHWLRTLAWTGGLVCVIALMAQAALELAA